MRRFIAAVASITAIAALAVPALASANVQRYQTQDATITASLNNGSLVHTFNVTVNPCDNTFVGTGTSTQTIPWSIHETVTGSLKDNKLSFDANYGDSAAGFPGWEQYVGYHWFSTGPNTAGSQLNEQFSMNTSVQLGGTSNYKNHGEYVSSQGGGSDAAHSCIGMPINSNK